MTPETLSHIGRALYGPVWKRALSDALGLNERLLRRWLNGSGYAVLPSHTVPSLIELCGSRIREIEVAKRDLEEMK